MKCKLADAERENAALTAGKPTSQTAPEELRSSLSRKPAVQSRIETTALRWR